MVRGDAVEIVAATVCWLALIEGAPAPLPDRDDLRRFPGEAVVEQAVRRAHDHGHYLLARMAFDRACGGLNQTAWQLLYDEQIETIGTWELLREAVCWSNREKLNDVKLRLGPARWWAGVMPDPAPWHHFQGR